MVRTPDRLPWDLRLRADEPAPPRQRPPDDLIAAARRGLLTRSNTRPGTQGRQAADSLVYQRRIAQRAKPGRTVREAAGHTSRVAPVAMAGIVLARDGEGRPVELHDVELSRRDVRRAARHAALIRQLLNGRLAPAMFRARVRRWAPFTVLGPPEVAGRYTFLEDADAVIALAERARAEDRDVWFTS